MIINDDFVPARLPGNEGKDMVLINKEGEVIRSRDGKRRKITLNKKGYCIIPIKSKGKYIHHRLHRAVALTFIEKPEHLKEVDFAELQVNHIDGNKLNNKVTNLEWVTNAENMKHARENNLFSNYTPVHAKSIKTGKIIKFDSLSDAGKFFFIHPGKLWFHLNSLAAGRVDIDGYQLLFSNCNNWPDTLMRGVSKKTLGMNLKVIAVNDSKNEILLASTLKQAIRLLKLNPNIVANSRQEKGRLYPVNGWVFYTHEDYISKYGEIS